MKRVIIGTSLLISSSIVIAGITISAAIRAVEITEWYTYQGKIWTAIIENKLLMPFLFSTGLFMIGLIILIKEFFNKNEKN
ncbi:hypothetical protein [uncultured Robinsoniella sp.]|uniref:hypothetical protein n=1 Tax=uncultured Robinsoniella sp. TaxID=904190 RepID=UPI00290BB2DD|nr:hypothetical protein [Clostridiales bacterium]MDU3240651.1 hypothetical protein [Clostridiales bacterium]